MSITHTLDLSADIIDVRDIIARIEELETEMLGEIPDGTTWKGSDADIEHRSLIAIMANIEGLGGDEKWRDHWYPLTLIRDSHFRDYAEELADDCGLIPNDAKWPMNCIDWEHAARELRYDYSAVDIEGSTYWTR